MWPSKSSNGSQTFRLYLCLTHNSSEHLARKRGDTFHARLDHLEVRYWIFFWCQNSVNLKNVMLWRACNLTAFHTMSHWFSGLPVCFPSWETRVQSPGGYFSETGILLLALSRYNVLYMWKIPLLSASLRFTKKWINLFHPCTHIQCLAGRSRDILLPAGRTQKRNLANLKTVSESWYPQESGTFQICKIPVLSAPSLHAKCCHFFWAGTVRICVGRRGGAWGLYCPLVTQNTQKHLKIQVYAFTVLHDRKSSKKGFWMKMFHSI